LSGVALGHAGLESDRLFNRLALTTRWAVRRSSSPSGLLIPLLLHSETTPLSPSHRLSSAAFHSLLNA